MLFRKKIIVPAGFEPAVNFELVTRRPLYIRSEDDTVHFVNFAPWFVKVSSEAACVEGVTFNIQANFRLEIPRTELADVLRASGHSDYSRPAEVSAQQVSERQQLAEVATASLQTFLRKSAFADLVSQQEHIRNQLNQQIQQECARAKLAGEVVSCEVVAVTPDQSLLGQLAALAGMIVAVQNGVPTRAYKAPTLGAVVEHFLETDRQKELIKANVERARAEGELAIVEAQQQAIKARTDLKIVEAEQEMRKSKRQAELDAERAQWDQEALQRNATIKETNAQFEYAYKAKRLDHDMDLARKEADLAKLKETSDATERDAKRLDLEQLEIFREREAAKIRAEERTETMSQLVKIIERMKDMPVPNYQGLHTLITTGMESQDPFKGLLLHTMHQIAESMTNAVHSPRLQDKLKNGGCD